MQNQCMYSSSIAPVLKEGSPQRAIVSNSTSSASNEGEECFKTVSMSTFFFLTFALFIPVFVLRSRPILPNGQ